MRPDGGTRGSVTLSPRASTPRPRGGPRARSRCWEPTGRLALCNTGAHNISSDGGGGGRGRARSIRTPCAPSSQTRPSGSRRRRRRGQVARGQALYVDRTIAEAMALNGFKGRGVELTLSAFQREGKFNHLQLLRALKCTCATDVNAGPVALFLTGAGVGSLHLRRLAQPPCFARGCMSHASIRHSQLVFNKICGWREGHLQLTC